MIGDGHLSWLTGSAIDGQIVIAHPVLLKRVELRFDPKIPEFTVHETDRDTELYTGLFVDLQQVSAGAIKNRKNELESASYHPLGWQDRHFAIQSRILSARLPRRVVGKARFERVEQCHAASAG